MTAIVGIADGRSVWMGADSFAGDSYALQMKESKIIERQLPDGSPILFGTTGELRYALLLETMPLPAHEPEVDARHYIGVALVDAMRDCFVKAGFGTKNNGGGDESGQSSVLVGYCGRLFSVWYSYDVVETAHPYQAVGSGMDTCLGALAVTEGIEHERRILMVLDAAERHNAYVRRPFTVKHITTDTPLPLDVVYVVGGGHAAPKSLIDRDDIN